MVFLRFLLYLVTVLLAVTAGETNLFAIPAYYWRSQPVGTPVTAQMLTLFCTACGTGIEAGHDIPLVAVLRDTLGEENISNHRVTAVWLLTYSHPTIGQKALAAIPFFYWNISDGSSSVKRQDTSPLLDLSAPQHPAVANVERQILQWTALDTLAVPVRATSRAYRTNEVDHERLHLEEANSYLLHAPISGGVNELTPEERDFVMARLELRKKLLGGFVNASRVTSLGKEAGFEQEGVRIRNWELLRQCAERTGLVFEPMRLAGSEETYGILWYPLRAPSEPGGTNLRPVWKLLDIKNPYSDDRLMNWTGPSTVRSLDEGGTLLPQDEPGAKTVKLVPLGVYSLSYPRQPLLLVDFRDKLKVRRHDVTQKAIDEITGGVIGLSHFANWYYFVGSDVYNFVQERRGRANNRAARLDSYSEFRVSLALDHDLDPALRNEMQRRAGSLSSNPLESSPENEMLAANNRYSWLTSETLGVDSRLIKRIDNQRREELAAFGATPKRQAMDIALHAATLGKYTRRAKRDDENISLLSTYRRVQHNLDFLETLVAAGTPPEIVYPEARVRGSVEELSGLMPSIFSPQIRTRAQQTLAKLSAIAGGEALRADCAMASQKILNDRIIPASGVPGVLTSPSISTRVETH